MTLTIGWPELLVASIAWVVVASARSWIEHRAAEAGGGMDVVPGSGLHQAPDAEEAEGRGRVGFR